MNNATEKQQVAQGHNEGQGHDKTLKIIVNGQEKEVAAKELSYTDLVFLVYGSNAPTGPNLIISITYKRGEGNKPQGSLAPGETVKVKEGMIFDVTPTNRS